MLLGWQQFALSRIERANTACKVVILPRRENGGTFLPYDIEISIPGARAQSAARGEQSFGATCVQQVQSSSRYWVYRRNYHYKPLVTQKLHDAELAPTP